MSKEKRPIIIVKKVKKAHGGHHGGSWKVAYADFVTAMMAFFMVMWILGMDSNVRSAIEAYFSNPIGLEKGYSSGASPLSTGHSPSVVSTKPLKLITRGAEQQNYKEIGERIETELAGANGLGSIATQVEVVMTEEGLRIELVEGGDGEMFFAFGSAELKPAASRALAVIAKELTSTDAPVVVEGHTDSAPFGRPGYTNWELSADRANAARRALEGAGLGRGRILEIRGHADRSLREAGAPLDPSNRRITVLLPFTSTEPDLADSEAVPTRGTA